jgi:hypothetical protein
MTGANAEWCDARSSLPRRMKNYLGESYVVIAVRQGEVEKLAAGVLLEQIATVFVLLTPGRGFNFYPVAATRAVGPVATL